MTKPMNHIQQLIEELCSEGVEFKTLGEIGTLIRGSGLQKKDFVEDGVGCIHYGQIYTYYGSFTKSTKTFVTKALAANLKKVNRGDLVIACTSENVEDVCKAVAWLGEEEIVTGGHSTIFKHHENPKYLSYFFQTQDFADQKKKYAKGTKVIEVSAKELAKIKIPLPPLPVQEAIVKILDTFTALEAELEAELEARKKQYEYYRDELLTFGEDVEWRELQEICNKIGSGGTPLTSKAGYYGGSVPWLRTQEVDWKDIYDTEIKITEDGLHNSSAKIIPANCVIVAMYGATAAKVAINKIPLATNQACCNLEIDQESASYKYVFHWLSHQYTKLKSLGEGSQSNINGKKIKTFKIPVPPLTEQERIVSILDKFDALVNDISIGLPAEIDARRRQYEYYRGKLLTFKEYAKQ